MRRGRATKSGKGSSHKRGGATRTGGLRPHRGQAQRYGGQVRTGGMRATRGGSYGKKGR
jgi:hypothetical protein